MDYLISIGFFIQFLIDDRSMQEADKGGAMKECGMITDVTDTEVETLATVSLRNTDGSVSLVSIKCKFPFKAYMDMACPETEH